MCTIPSEAAAREIAASSGEQSDGVAEITPAMQHHSSAKQQTASACEPLLSNAEQLSALAQQLQELMSHFRLADDGRAAATAGGLAFG